MARVALHNNISSVASTERDGSRPHDGQKRKTLSVFRGSLDKGCGRVLQLFAW